MELVDFLRNIQSDVKSQIHDSSNPFSESIFTEIVMQHLADTGMTYEPQVCHHTAAIGNTTVRLSGYAISEENDQLDVFVSLYSGAEDIQGIPDSELKAAAEQCIRFLSRCVDGRAIKQMEESAPAYAFAHVLQGCYAMLDQIQVFILTDRQSKSKNFTPRESNGKTIKLEVMDIERLFRHCSEGKPRDEIAINFEDLAGGPLPCVFVAGGTGQAYDYALTALPGETLRFLYEKYGARLLEDNVRSFLSVTGKVNKGIRDTLRESPELFLAYNNGIVMTCESLSLGESKSGGAGIAFMKGMGIVNGGQTTASIYFSKKKQPEIDLTKVWVPAKIIVVKDEADNPDLVPLISKYANSQNVVKQADLSANKPFHQEMERISTVTFCPDGLGRWFYERAAGSYNVMLAKEGTTPARLRALRDSIPPQRRITKTDLAKYLTAWDQEPHMVSLGSQKNFTHFMNRLDENKTGLGLALPLQPTVYKKLVARTIIFRTASKLVRPIIPAFQANVTAYLVSMISMKYGKQIDHDRIWRQQDLSPQFKQLIQRWALEVNTHLKDSSNGKMISEWAKRPECWEYVRKADYTVADETMPELIVTGVR